jgi:hypothetical protein
MLEKLLKEIARLREAERILKAVYINIGPYNERGISTEVSQRINDHFSFDDSE